MKPALTATSLYGQELYHKMIEEVEDYAILMMDTEGYIINWNRGAEKIKGYKAQEIISKNFRIFYTKADQEDGLPERLLKLGATTGKAHHEGWRVRKDGTTFWGSIVITAMHNDSGGVIGFTKVTRDLTERKIAEDKAKADALELAKANSELLVVQQQLEQKIDELHKVNKEMERFAFIASHDLQEPVRKIRTFFFQLQQLNKDTFDNNSKVLSEKIITSTVRIQTLIEDLLTLSTITENPALVPVDLNKVASDVVEELEIRIAEKNAIIEIEPLPVVKGIASYLVQLFLNLVSNALKFSDKPPLVKISAAITGDKAIIKIQDNGIGIEKEHHQKIFESFQRLHAKHQYEGTGIGLAICKRIVDVHAGGIDVESGPGVGTTFIIRLQSATMP